MVNDVIGGHVTSKCLKILCKFFLFSSKNMRQHFFVKCVKTKLSFGPNGRKIHKIYHCAISYRFNLHRMQKGYLLTSLLKSQVPSEEDINNLLKQEQKAHRRLGTRLRPSC